MRVPAAIPSFFAGLRIAAAYTVAGAVIGEFVAGDRGLGVFIQLSKANFRVDRIFVAVVVIAVLSALAVRSGRRPGPSRLAVAAPACSSSGTRAPLATPMESQ